MFQGISTKYYGPTNARGSRIRAKTASGHVKWIAWDHALSIEGNHVAAARALATALAWSGEWYGGALEDGYAFVSARRTGSSAFVIE